MCISSYEFKVFGSREAINKNWVFDVTLRFHIIIICKKASSQTVIHMHTEIKNHRLSAFVYGFMSGLGLILINWGLASIIALPLRSSTIYVGLILLGVFLFAGGSCREAYLRGSLSNESSVSERVPIKQLKHVASVKPSGQSQTEAKLQPSHQKPANPIPMTAEQIRDPVETQTHETAIYEQEA